MGVIALPFGQSLLLNLIIQNHYHATSYRKLFKKIFIDCIIVSVGFATIESIFRWYHDNGFTTIEQFIMNFIYTPIMIHLYKKIIKNWYIRIICFPFNVWIAEILMGTYLLHVHEKRVWYYNDEYAYLDGMITLSFVHYWMILGSLAFTIF